MTFFIKQKKNISVRPLFNLYYLSLFQLPFTRSKIIHFMEDLSLITALNHKGSFGKHFVKSQKNNVICHPWLVRIMKNCAITVKYRYSRPWAQFYPIRTSRPVNNIYHWLVEETHTYAPTHPHTHYHHSLCYVLKNMLALTDLRVTCGRGKFRWLDYPNFSALDKSCEMYNFARCSSSCRLFKKGQF